MVCSSEFHETVVIVLVFLVKNHFTGKCSLAECWAVFLSSFFFVCSFFSLHSKFVWLDLLDRVRFYLRRQITTFVSCFCVRKFVKNFHTVSGVMKSTINLPTGFGALSQFDDPIKKLHLHESENIRNKKENFVHRAQPKKRVMLHHFALWLTNFIRIWIHNLDENRVNTLRNSICARKVRSCLLKAEN